MIIKFIMLSLIGYSAYATEPPMSGSSNLSLELATIESHIITENLYVMDSQQQLTASCPLNARLVTANCNAEGLASNHRGFSDRLLDRPIFTDIKLNTKEGTSFASCHATSVRPDQIVKLSILLNCDQLSMISTASN